MNKQTSIRRTHPAKPIKPIKPQPVHETKVMDMATALAVLKSLYLNLKKAIDQETLVVVDRNGDHTQVAFVMGTTEMRFNLKEGGMS